MIEKVVRMAEVMVAAKVPLWVDKKAEWKVAMTEARKVASLADEKAAEKVDYWVDKLVGC